MTNFKSAKQGIVGQSFTCLAAVQPGDTVAVTGDWTVGHSTTAVPIGEVIAKPYGVTTKCTVELYSSKIETAVADGAIVAGERVKMGSARTKVKKVTGLVLTEGTPNTIADDSHLAIGVALVGVADGATVTYVVL